MHRPGVALQTLLLTATLALLAGFLTAAPYYADEFPMLARLAGLRDTIALPTLHINSFKPAAATATRTMTTIDGTTLPSSWHSGPDDSFHGKITADGPFKPEKDRYHLYIGYFCPFAHRANLARTLKELDKYANIDISVVKPYPKGNDKGWPGWRFNHKDEEGEPGGADYPGATVDKLFGSRFMHEVYFEADKDYSGRYSVPVLWDKKLGTIVNNESAELLRDLQTAFDEILPEAMRGLTLYPEELRKDVESIAGWMGDHLNTGVYKAGFAPNQEVYDKNLPPVFAALNKLEKIAKQHGGPYILGSKMTEIDVRAYATLIRFDPVYVQHFKCNLGTIRYSYPVLHNWLKGMYWNHEEYRNTTEFKHIKENYTKSHYDVNPKAITPLGPWPNIEKGYEEDWSKMQAGEIDMPEVLQFEKNLG